MRPGATDPNATGSNATGSNAAERSVVARRFEAVVAPWDPTTAPDAARASVRTAIESASAAGLHVALVGGPDGQAADAALGIRPPGCGRLLLGSEGTGEVLLVDHRGVRRIAQAAADALEPGPLPAVRRALAGLGVGTGATLVLGDAPDGAAGAARITATVADQVERRHLGELPALHEAPSWTIAVEGLDPERERFHEALLTLADGKLGTSGSPLVLDEVTTPWVLAAGLYHGEGPATQLLECPAWHRITTGAAARAVSDAPRDERVDLRRVLDLQAGLLHERQDHGGTTIESVRFSSLARPATGVLRAVGPGIVDAAGAPLEPPRHAAATATGVDDGAHWMQVAASTGGVSAAAVERVGGGGGPDGLLDRVAAYDPDPERLPEPSRALHRARDAAHTGFDRLLAEHREAWAARWADADLLVDDEEVQLAARFALFTLLGSAAGPGEAAVGARGLSGPAYRGHVFWDADVFVLPALAATHPTAARAMLEYRIRRLPAALAAARAQGHAGARFPWESARSGFDVTPTSARDRAGHVLPIRTGLLEVHIVGCVAWAAACYVDWTGDHEFEHGPGRELLVETARFWAARIRTDDRGRGHIYGVIGPDEYHEPVDDNAFTNVLARWNLRRAAAVDADLPDEERSRWLELADGLVDGYDARTGRYEQFSGFDRLEPLIIADVAPRRPIAASLLLGAARLRGAQVLKQADVLMLHHLVPEEVEPGSLEPNLDYYEPRTAHGSSLSPGVHAALLARAGRTEPALEALRLAARIDLRDLTGSTAGGLHLAALGSVWQALVFGFGGIRPRAGVLSVDPRLPESWGVLDVGVRYHGARVRVRVERDHLDIGTDTTLLVAVGGVVRRVDPSGLRLRRASVGWRDVGPNERPPDSLPTPDHREDGA